MSMCYFYCKCVSIRAMYHNVNTYKLCQPIFDMLCFMHKSRNVRMVRYTNTHTSALGND